MRSCNTSGTHKQRSKFLFSSLSVMLFSCKLLQIALAQFYLLALSNTKLHAKKIMLLPILKRSVYFIILKNINPALLYVIFIEEHGDLKAKRTKIFLKCYHRSCKRCSKCVRWIITDVTTKPSRPSFCYRFLYRQIVKSFLH